MNVQEALEKVTQDHLGRYAQSDSFNLAPIIDRALRAAYSEGWQGCNDGSPHVLDRGVTAGVAAMMEES